MMVCIAAQRCIRPVTYCFYLVTTRELVYNLDNLSINFISFTVTIKFRWTSFVKSVSLKP